MQNPTSASVAHRGAGRTTLISIVPQLPLISPTCSNLKLPTMQTETKMGASATVSIHLHLMRDTSLW